jgi:hypothetical protein
MLDFTVDIHRNLSSSTRTSTGRMYNRQLIVKPHVELKGKEAALDVANTRRFL